MVDFPAINRGYTQILSHSGDRAQVHTAKHVYVANVYRQGGSVNNRVVNVFRSISVGHGPVFNGETRVTTGVEVTGSEGVGGTA